MEQARRTRHRTPFDERKSRSLDRLLEAENVAQNIVTTLTSQRVRDDIEMHPELEGLSERAWLAFCRISAQRAACERVWRVPT